VSHGAAASDELTAALEADLATRLRACPQSVALEHGWAIRDQELAAVHHLNAIVLGTAAPLDPATYDADAIEQLARRWQDQSPDRCIVIDDEPAAERLAAELPERGWEQQRTLLMALRSDPATALRDARARELGEEELRSLQLACLQQEVVGPSVPRELPGRLSDAQALLRATTTSLRFGAAHAGAEPAASCTLFLDANVGGRRVATVEAVATLREYREQGLARAAVSMALRAADEWSADLIVVATDADDWPQLMYASLGFRELGRRRQFTRRTGSG
jgi:GNAT superfamily N-acetyltransferase